jgi:hypothetical protein
MNSILQHLNQSNQSPSTETRTNSAPNNQNGLNQAVEYVKSNGGDLRECCFKRGHELGMSDIQINQAIETARNNILQMVQASQNPQAAIQNAMLARTPIGQLAGMGKDIQSLISGK